MSTTDGTAGDSTAGQSPHRRVDIVPHTHWDREWYRSFQAFRLRLVDLLDDLIPRMEADPSFARFLLDGQLAVVDDYLAVRPEAEERLRRLVGAGRIAVGPWYTLPDEFLVSGETLIRNLQLGLHTGDRFGGAMTVGYLPDMFGHIAQMPQVLRQFGFEHAVVWRGVPAAVDSSGFWWQAPDGSTVRAEYLPQGYGNGSAVPDDAKELVAQVSGFAELWSELLTGPILWMVGTDHQVPRPWLGGVVAEANDIQDKFDLRIVGLAEHLAASPTDGLPEWQGELRSGARANVLMGVVSNRGDVRAAAARAERAVERLAEPLCALFLPKNRWPGALLDEAWRDLVLNAAHDSVCACSIDDVCDAVLHRYSEATDIGIGLAERAVANLAARVAHIARDGPVAPSGDPGSPGDDALSHAGIVVVNPTARPRQGIVELTLPGTDAPAGTQLLRTRPADTVLVEGPVQLVVPATEEIDWLPNVDAFALEDGDGTVLVAGQRESATQMITGTVRAELDRIVASPAVGLDATDDDRTLRLRVRQAPEVTVLAYVADVPGFGWSAWQPSWHPGATDGSGVESVRVEDDTHMAMSNGLVHVEVDPRDGTYAVNGHRGLGRLVDGGDCGDTYNWCPPAHDTLVDAPDEVDVTVVESGPLRARVDVTARYRWPERCEGFDRRTGEVGHHVTTRLELRAGERFLRVQVTADNRSRDHRLRAHFPLPDATAGSRAECAFATVDRALDAEGGPTEAPLATYPARRFVRAGGLTVVHDRVAEYELVGVRDGLADELALTLLRCTGVLSQRPMTTRPLPAGPLVATEGAQLQQRVSFSYAVAIGDVDPYVLADELLVPLMVATSDLDDDRTNRAIVRDAAGETLPPTGSALTVAGAEVSAVWREGDRLAVRVFNPSPDTTDVIVDGRRGWLVDLRGRPIEPFEGRFSLRPWGIATAQLAD